MLIVEDAMMSRTGVMGCRIILMTSQPGRTGPVENIIEYSILITVTNVTQQRQTNRNIHKLPEIIAMIITLRLKYQHVNIFII